MLREYQAVYPQKVKEKKFETPKELGYEARQRKEEQDQKKREEQKKPVRPVIDPAKESLSDDQVTVLRVLSVEEAMQADDVIELTELTARRVLSALTVLVMDGFAEEESGKRFRRTVELKG